MTALDKVIKILGSAAALARKLGIQPQAVYQWDQAPAARVLQVEKAVGGAVTREELRPDIYPPEDAPNRTQKRAAA